MFLFADYWGDSALARAHEAAAKTAADSNTHVAMIVGVAIVLAALIFAAVTFLKKQQ